MKTWISFFLLSLSIVNSSLTFAGTITAANCTAQLLPVGIGKYQVQLTLKANFDGDDASKLTQANAYNYFGVDIASQPLGTSAPGASSAAAGAAPTAGVSQSFYLDTTTLTATVVDAAASTKNVTLIIKILESDKAGNGFINFSSLLGSGPITMKAYVKTTTDGVTFTKVGEGVDVIATATDAIPNDVLKDVTYAKSHLAISVNWNKASNQFTYTDGQPYALSQVQVFLLPLDTVNNGQHFDTATFDAKSTGQQKDANATTCFLKGINEIKLDEDGDCFSCIGAVDKTFITGVSQISGAKIIPANFSDGGITLSDLDDTKEYIVASIPNNLSATKLPQCRRIKPKRNLTLTEINGAKPAEYKDPRCFIVSASYGNNSWMVNFYRHLRDKYLMSFDFGKKIVQFYYNNSEPFADFLKENTVPRLIVRGLLFVPAMLMWPVEFFGFSPILIFLLASLVAGSELKRRKRALLARR